VAGFVNEQSYTAYSHRSVHACQMSKAVGYLRAQAERCLRLAKACTNPYAVKSLQTMAADSFERANEMEDGAMKQTEHNQSPQEK
jgi:hypothetical protein